MLGLNGFCRARRAPGFTMIELLVVIVVLGLLISMVIAVASKAIGQQKIRNTRQTMQNLTLAMEQFATEDPLRAIYDRKGRQTFGKYPPYQLANASTLNSVSRALELNHALTPGSPSVPTLLSDRLARDLSGTSSPDNDHWVEISREYKPEYPDGDDDIRALYAYLRVYSPESLRTIPDTVLKPIDTACLDYVNPKGSGGVPGTGPGQDWIDVPGIYDAWGVPLDYMLYVKCEYRLPAGGTSAQWVVTERKPVLRSRGIKREVYDAWVASDEANPTQRARSLSPPKNWIFSEDLPRPWAGLTDGPAYRTGLLPASPSGSTADGWSRAVGLQEDYAYRPDGDNEPP